MNERLPEINIMLHGKTTLYDYDAAYQIQIFEHFMVKPKVMQHILFLLSTFSDFVLLVS